MTRFWCWVGGFVVTMSTVIAQSASFQEGISGGEFAATQSCVIHNSGGDGTTSKGPTLTLGEGNGLLAFPRSVGNSVGQIPPGAQLSSATLELYVVSVPGAAPMRTLSAHPIYDVWGSGPWQEPSGPVSQGTQVGASWLSRDSRSGIGALWTQAGGDVFRLGAPISGVTTVPQGSGFWVSLDVTLVLSGHAQGWSNQGWSLEVDQGGNDLIIASEDHPNPALHPRLNVSWNGVGPAANHVPSMDDKSLTTPQGVSKFIPFHLVDQDGQAVQFVVREEPQHGTLQGQGWYSYVPNPGYTGSDSFTLFAHDGFASSRLVRVTMDVQPTSTNNTSVFSTTAGTASVRSTTVTISEDPNAQGSEEGSELAAAAGVSASLIDFPGIIGGAGGLPLGAVILSAQLELSVTQVQGTALTRSFEIVPLLNPASAAPWFEPTTPGSGNSAGASWLYRDARPSSLIPWLVPGGACDLGRGSSTSRTALQSGDILSFDLTAAVQSWALGASTSGLRLLARESDETRVASDEHPNVALRPRLSVVWRGTNATPVALPPIAAAGPDQSVVANQQVFLDASGSYDPNGQALSFLWAQISGPPVVLSDPTQPTLSFQAPMLLTPGILEFSVLVNDGSTSSLDNLRVSVAPAPLVPDAPPVADAGPDQDVFEGGFVILDGGASFDPEGLPLNLSWLQVSGPSVSLSPIPGTARTLFQAPAAAGSNPLLLHFRLLADDGVHQAYDWMELRVHPSPNLPPQALVSGAQDVEAGTWTGMDATASTDPDPYTQLSYSWSQLSGPAVVLFRNTTPVPYFKAPAALASTPLVFEVTVSDGVASAQASTTVTVIPTVSQFNGSAQSLAPYSTPLTPDEARHLLRRAGFSGSRSDVATVVAQGLDTTVAQMLIPTQNPLLDFAAWSSLPAPVGQDQYPQVSTLEASQWWLTYMLESSLHNQLREKIAYFYHDLFAASGRVAGNREQHWVMEHIDLFRSNPFPNYRDFLIALTHNNLMLDWLDGHDSVVGAANENYAREFWELFTLGERHPFTGNLNYSEADIRESARALTGWERYDPGNIGGDSYYSRFELSRFDSGLKTVFGQTGPWSDIDIIDITLARPEAAEYICYKLFRFFVHDQPDYATIQSLAQMLSSGNWEIAPIVSTLLKSEAMFSPEARRSKIKTPVELLVGFSRETGLRLPVNDIAERLEQLNQELTNPPSVKGWEEGIFLLGAAASSQRAQAINAIANSGFLPANLNLQSFLPAPGLRNGPKSIASVLSNLDIDMEDAGFHLAVEYMDSIDSAGGGSQASYFNGDDPAQLDRKIRGLFFILAVANPEYQLN